MKLGYTIIYVPNIQQALDFYEQAFGLSIRFLHESNMYGEMETGSTTLAFVAEAMSEHNGLTFTKNRPEQLPAGIEIAFVTDNVEQAYKIAVQVGAQAVVAPVEKPWGQIIAYVRDLNGVLIEICSPMGS